MNPYLWLAGLIFVLACTAGGYRIGAKVTKADYQAKVIEQQKAAEREHRQHELSLAAIGTDLSKERAAHEATRRADRKRALDGDVRLRFTSSGKDCTSPAPVGSDGPQTSELPREITADLLDLANDADEVAKQLAACQAVVLEDRK